MEGMILLVLLCVEVSAEFHSLQYLATAQTATQHLPGFVIVGYVDGAQFFNYDSDQKKLIAQGQWMVENKRPPFWERSAVLAQQKEKHFKTYIEEIAARTNQSGGIHWFQLMTGCDLREDGTTTGFSQFGWDGQDYMKFDKDHQDWVTTVRWGESTKKWWEDIRAWNNQHWKYYLEEECIHWLNTYLDYGQQMLSTIAPAVSFTRLGDSNRLSCLVTGFYPQAIEVTLWRDGVLVDETLSTGILPNHDRTYQIRKWMEFDPDDQSEYSCRVEHTGLEDKLVVIFVLEFHSQVFVAIGILLGVLIVITVLLTVVIIYKEKARRKSDYITTHTSDDLMSSVSSVASS
ncbi:major histocompatibility complex class I-related gene protein-like isoform X1 [Stegostoma tigrinum]|uniref:major histocompatibility complex class I-related gene protein-like isoform X1 n=1 Tax=Stegostoma tigrinum TaxID=3053191 RepID=UPI00202B6DA1|nr:major histocompatibility complex class I-related gene protein-like isoform X1 [Stegostoma tigrinum]